MRLTVTSPNRLFADQEIEVSDELAVQELVNAIQKRYVLNGEFALRMGEARVLSAGMSLAAAGLRTGMIVQMIQIRASSAGGAPYYQSRPPSVAGSSPGYQSTPPQVAAPLRSQPSMPPQVPPPPVPPIQSTPPAAPPMATIVEAGPPPTVAPYSPPVEPPRTVAESPKTIAEPPQEQVKEPEPKVPEQVMRTLVDMPLPAIDKNWNEYPPAVEEDELPPKAEPEAEPEQAPKNMAGATLIEFIVPAGPPPPVSYATVPEPMPPEPTLPPAIAPSTPGAMNKTPPLGSLADLGAAVHSALVSEDGQVFRLSQPIVRLGRAGNDQQSRVDIDLSALDPNKTTSRPHAQIELRKGQYFVRDLMSSNHVMVNSVRTTPGVDCPLQDGDKLQLGSVHLTFRVVRQSR